MTETHDFRMVYFKSFESEADLVQFINSNDIDVIAVTNRRINDVDVFTLLYKEWEE